MTPVRLWQDYDPEALALESSFLRYEKQGGLTYMEAYITAFSAPDGKARTFVKGFIPEGSCSCAVLADDGRYNSVKDEYLRDMAELGITALTFDYNGNTSEKSVYSHYPESISYANFRTEEERRYKAFPTSYDTCM